MRFRPVVVALRSGRGLRWRGKLLLPGLLDGEQWFELQPLDGGRTRLTQGEAFSGLLVPLPGERLLGPTSAGFRQMNAALKRVAEAP